jgi:methyl-accepting chemotaxis protein
MKDSKPLLLALLAAGLVITWVYHIYDKSNYSNLTREVFVKDSTAVAEAVTDSLRKYYTRTLDQLGVEKMQIDSSNNLLKGELGVKITEINKLRNEIGNILKRKDLNQYDLAEAKSKIDDLQQRMEDLKTENTSLTDERSKLNNILAQLNGEMNSLQQNMQKVSAENKLFFIFYCFRSKICSCNSKGSKRNRNHSAKKSKQVCYFIYCSK